MSHLSHLSAISRQVSKLWNAVSALRLISQADDKEAKSGEFPESVEFIADGLANTISNIQQIIDETELKQIHRGQK